MRKALIGLAMIPVILTVLTWGGCKTYNYFAGDGSTAAPDTVEMLKQAKLMLEFEETRAKANALKAKNDLTAIESAKTAEVNRLAKEAADHNAAKVRLDGNTAAENYRAAKEAEIEVMMAELNAIESEIYGIRQKFSPTDDDKRNLPILQSRRALKNGLILSAKNELRKTLGQMELDTREKERAARAGK